MFLDYADTAKATFIDAGGKWVNWANFIRKLLNTFLCLSQILSNAVYVLFIAQNIKPVSLKVNSTKNIVLNIFDTDYSTLWRTYHG